MNDEMTRPGNQVADKIETSSTADGGKSLPPGPARAIKASSAAVIDGKLSLKSVVNASIPE